VFADARAAGMSREDWPVGMYRLSQRRKSGHR
jgi:hypothetical protein